MRAALRICPQCGHLLSGSWCPADGSATEPSQRQDTPPGSAILERFVVGACVEDYGAMAIHEGYELETRKPVRIALLAVPAQRPADERARLLAAKRPLERLDHPGIAKVLAAGMTERGELAIVESSVGGQTLAETLHLGPLGSARAIDLGIALLAALEAAHAAGFSHDDLSSSHVRMLPEGKVVMTDLGFSGLAFPFAPSVEAHQEAPKGALPEQARAQPASHQPDLYAVGAILFEALSGRPFEAALAGEDDADVSQLEVPAPLRAFLARCLDKKPWNRFDDAKLAREALEAARVEGTRAPEQADAPALDAPESGPSTREMNRPRRAVASGPLVPAARIFGASAFDDLVAESPERNAPGERMPTAQIARPVVRYVRARRSWMWLAAAIVVIVLGGIALSR